jgi:hypothetical protein
MNSYIRLATKKVPAEVFGDVALFQMGSCMRPPFGILPTKPGWLSSSTSAGVLRLTVQPAGRIPMNHSGSGWRFIDLRRISVVFASSLAAQTGPVSSPGVGRTSGTSLGSVCRGVWLFPTPAHNSTPQRHPRRMT